MDTPLMRYMTALLCSLILIGCSQPDPPTVNLYRAVHAGDLDQIKRHIHHKTDINQIDRDGRMALHVAAEKGKQIIVRLLVNNGARLDARDSRDDTPLESALMAGKVAVASFLQQQGAPFDAQELLLKSIDRDVDFRDVFEYLTEQGAQVNATLENGDTPLFHAISTGQRRVVRRLIDRGADVNKARADGLAPLTHAMNLGNDDIVRLLKRNGAVENP